MKNYLLTLLLSVLAVSQVFSQAPHTFQYQAVVRNALGEIVSNQYVGLQISIRADAPDATPLYQETHFDTTNAFGLLNLAVGQGSATTGDFGQIQWQNHTHYLSVALDLNAGSNFKPMGTTQLLSVPYALHAQSAANVFSGNYFDLSNRPNLATYLQRVETNTWDKDTTNELQQLAIQGFELTVSGGNSITLPDSVVFATIAASPNAQFMLPYSQVLDKPQLSLQGDTIYLTDGGWVNLPDTVALSLLAEAPTANFMLDYSKVTNNPDADLDATNELQALSIVADTVFLEKGSYVVLPDSVHYAAFADTVPRLEEYIDSLEQVVNNKADQTYVDSLEKRLNAQANMQWLSKDYGFYVDARDKQRYEFRVIGEQVWMTENLRTGTVIASSAEPSDNGLIEAYAYNDQAAYIDTTGGLYTWREMMQLPDSCLNTSCAELIQPHHQGICPDGWHIADTSEWRLLFEELGGLSVAGQHLKKDGETPFSNRTTWLTPNDANADNSSQFTALPGGIHLASFSQLGTDAYFGQSTEKDQVNSYLIRLKHNDTAAFEEIENKAYAASVRCVQDP